MPILNAVSRALGSGFLLNSNGKIYGSEAMLLLRHSSMICLSLLRRCNLWTHYSAKGEEPEPSCAFNTPNPLYLSRPESLRIVGSGTVSGRILGSKPAGPLDGE